MRWYPWWEPLDLEVALISPVETWGGDACRYGLSEVTPAQTALCIPGKEEVLTRFSVTRPGGGSPYMWAWAKLMCHGKPSYKPVPGTTA